MANTSRTIGRGLAMAVLITFVTATTSHLIGHGREVPHMLTDGFRLGYYVGVALAAAAALATFALLPKRAREGRRVTWGIRIGVAIAAVVVCSVGTDFAAGLSHKVPIGAYATQGAYTFVSAPALHPPVVRADVSVPGQLAKGYIFLANFYDPSSPATMVGQSGPLILDQRLSPVWFEPVPENDLAGNLSLQTYEGKPVLAWWQGVVNNGGFATTGEYIVVDQHYRAVARLRGADGWMLSLHEIVIQGDDAWVTASKNVRMNLSAYGGARDGGVVDAAVQEYNLKTGQLLESWDALGHIPLRHTFTPAPTNGSLWDAYHVNSIELLGHDSFVVSMRNTWAAYKVSISTGKIDWTLGGKASSFALGPGAQFEWQHNVVVYPGTSLVTVFDDHCCQITDAGTIVRPTAPSRGLVLKLDSASHTATLADQYTYSANLDSEYMGNLQPLPDGNEFVGWGSEPRFSEYTASGRMVLDGVLPGPDISYRATVEPWVGLPLYPPSGAARETAGKVIVYASWNGATQVTSWRVLAGARRTDLVAVKTARKDGFETAIAVAPGYRDFRVQALDAHGGVIGSSARFSIGS